MKILGIESASMVASVAVATEAGLLAEYTVDFKKTHSQTLLPMIDEITRMVGLDLETIDAIAVSAGPGSFTGLRIGSATAKGIGPAKAADLGADHGRHGLWPLRDVSPDLSHHGRQTAASVYGTVPF